MGERSVIIVGGGVIGLAIGRELAGAGREVDILERGEVGQEASWAAAGMLAPAAELEFEAPELYRLSRESLNRWPAYARDLEEEIGTSVDFRTEPTLIVADDRDSAQALRREYEFQRKQGLPVEWLNPDQATEEEPFLSSQLTAAVRSPGDHQIDNRLLIKALRESFIDRGGRIFEHTCVKDYSADCSGVRLRTAEGKEWTAETVVIAAGAWSGQIEGLDGAQRPPVRPVKGQVVELEMSGPFSLSHVVRGPEAYLVPKSDGRLMVGATSEEKGFDDTVTAGAVLDLLEGAREVVPGIYELPITDIGVGFRPGSRDNGPILGPSGMPGVVLATGHFRHGILLTPVTAQEISRFVVTGEATRWLETFSPLRFTRQ